MLKKIVVHPWLAPILALFWYLLLFPGRVHVDSESQLDLMSEGKSTSQWTAVWFRYLQIFTLNGRTVFIATFFCALLTFFTLRRVIQLICEDKSFRTMTLNLMYLTPLIGYSSITLNHDIVSTCGLLLSFISLFTTKDFSTKRIIFLIFYASLALTSFIGLIGVFTSLAIFILTNQKKNFKVKFTLASSLIFFILGGSIGVQRPPLSVVLLPMISDVKCIAQSKNGQISDRDWQVLIKIQSKESWTEKESCSSANSALNSDSKPNLLGRDFVETYIRILSQNSLHVIQAHLIRSSSAIPAPFLVPQNAPYSLDDDTLQLGIQKQNGLLLISRSKYGESGAPFIGALEPFVSITATAINFFSHIIGWGGLMFLIIMVAPTVKFVQKRKLLIVLSSMHLFLFLWSPVNDNRYLLTTNLFAWAVIANLLSQKFFRSNSSINNIYRS